MIIVNGKEIQCVVHNGIVCPMYLNGKLITPTQEPETSVTIGGRVYPIVKIGNQIWLAENLDYKFSGIVIGPSESTSPPTLAAWYYDNDEATYGIDGTRKCGLLYNWYAVKLLNDNRSELIPGWHVPTKDEWMELVNTVGGTDVAGTKLKASNVSWATDWDGTDDYGFGVLPAGVTTVPSFLNVGSNAAFWTATESDYSAYFCVFAKGSSILISNNSNNDYGYSVRLVKD